MEPIENFKDVIAKPYKVGKRLYSDTIYTFDIECSNLFYINGKYRSFDPTIPQHSYDDMISGEHVVGYDEIDKKCCPYIGMFSVNDKVYYFRDMYKLEDILKEISNPNVTKYIYIHNLAYEMAVYRYLWIKYNITDLIALKSRKPIQFYVPYFNIVFRCSLRLTELSLEKCGETYTDIHKLVGSLDYDKARSPLTPLSEQELAYCEYDCLVLYETIKYFRKLYKHIKSIPSTQTGTVRRAYKGKVPKSHIYNMQKMVPSVHEYKMLYMAFQGGLTHANAINANRVLYEEILSLDECSAYPSVMFLKYPDERFRKIDPAVISVYDPEEYAFLYDVTFNEFTSKYYNHYIPASKVLEGTLKHGIYDNGRIVSADSARMILTDIDFEIIKKAYDIYSIEIHEVMVAHKDYLPSHYLDYICELYENKTRYKDVEGMEEIYMLSKVRLNSLFGCCCTNTIRSTVEYDSEGIWHEGVQTDEIIRKKLEEERNNKSLLFAFSTGCWITAYNRKRLFEKILDIPGMDYDVVYYDTDSLKIRDGYKYINIFNEYDKIVDEDIKKACDARGIDFYRTRPMDPKGERHPLGHWEIDAIYEEFITLGAKRYAYRKGGKIGITVAGVGKGNELDGYSADALNNDLENFNEYLVFDYEHAHKLEHTYVDNQMDFDFDDYMGIPYHCAWNDGVVLKPTTYSMSLTDAYRSIIEYLFSEFSRDKDIIKEKRYAYGKDKFIR